MHFIFKKNIKLISRDYVNKKFKIFLDKRVILLYSLVDEIKNIIFLKTKTPIFRVFNFIL